MRNPPNKLLAVTRAYYTAAADPPPARNLLQEGKQQLQAAQQTGPAYLALNQQLQPGYTKLGLYDTALGQNGYYDANGNYQPGSVALGQQANTSNRGAALSDLNTYGASGTAGILGSNPYLAQGLGLQSQAATAAGATSPLLAQLQTQASRQVGGGSSPFLNMLQTQAKSQFNQTPAANPLLDTLQTQARSQLSLGGALSGAEKRDLGQQTLAGFAARGVGGGNSSLAADLLSRDAATRARAAQAQQFAGAVQGMGQAQQGLNLQQQAMANQFGTGVQGAAQAFQNQNQNFATGVQGLSQNQQQLAGNLAGNYASTASSALTNPLLQMLGLGNLNPGYGGGSGAGGSSAIANAGNLFQPNSGYAQDLFNTNYNAQASSNIANASAQNNQNNALIGLAGSLLLSDKRLKRKIKKVGESPSGIPEVEFEYKTGEKKPARFRGYLAQDVEKIRPGAVVTLPGGIKAVRRALVDAPFYPLPAGRKSLGSLLTG